MFDCARRVWYYRKTMKVYVDNKEVEVFTGAKAADAARAAGAKRIAKLYDAYGNEIAPDSPMKSGRKIFTHNPKK